MTDEPRVPEQGETDAGAAEPTGRPWEPGPPPEGSARTARWLAIAALVLAAAALVLVPILTGVLGMGFGMVSHAMGDRLGIRGAVAAGVAMVIGLSLQALFFGSGGVAS